MFANTGRIWAGCFTASNVKPRKREVHGPRGWNFISANRERFKAILCLIKRIGQVELIHYSKMSPRLAGPSLLIVDGATGSIRGNILRENTVFPRYDLVGRFAIF